MRALLSEEREVYLMVDVLLAHSYFLKYDTKQLAKMRPYPPLATLYAAAYLRSVGYTVAVFDAMLAEGEHEFEAMLATHRPRYVAIIEDSFNFLVKMCLTRMREAAGRMSRAARATGATVIAAGPDISDHPQSYFVQGVQYALLGEADHTLRELLDALTGRQPRPIHEIAGLALPDQDGVCRTAQRAPERNLDVFPLPAWDLCNLDAYRAAWVGAHGRYSVNLVTTRGCPFHCNWCAKPIWGQQYAIRSPANVAEEMALLKCAVKPDHIWFADDIFGLRGQWVTEFAKEVEERDARIPFTIQSRVDLMTERTVAALARAGCEEVWLGAESGSQQVLDAMDKGTDVAEIAVARTRLKAAGIKASFFLQFGYPGETFADVMATVQMVRDCLPDNIGVSVSYPLPGTRFYDMVREQLGQQTHWVESNDLAMMFQGTYRSSFYRHLHRLIHHDLDLRQRLHAGETGGVLVADLDRLNSEWLELGQLERDQLSPLPTRIVASAGRLPVPDLGDRMTVEAGQ
jgi:anaerobic magnesium-protoporphyrin IX monomethyl ester cyclase